jgi:hypothetical protein
MNLKADSSTQLSTELNKSVMPLLQLQNGFLNGVTLIDPNYSRAIGDTYWKTQADAEAYQQNGYLKVLKILSEFNSGMPKDSIFEVPVSSIYQVGMEKPYLIENKVQKL